jgi:hypothetical protein
MIIRYRYKSVRRPDGSEERTPSIPVIFVGEKNRQEFIALLDSGADISFIPKGIAEILGLKIEGIPITPAYGISVTINTVQTKMGIIVGRGSITEHFIIPVKVALDQYDFPPILGRFGFFDKFSITFDESEKHVTLKRAKNKT